MRKSRECESTLFFCLQTFYEFMKIVVDKNPFIAYNLSIETQQHT